MVDPFTALMWFTAACAVIVAVLFVEENWS